MKTLVFDAGPVISLTTSNLLGILPELKKKFKGRFVITEEVKAELVDKPLATKRFEFEALQVMSMIDSGILEVVKVNNYDFLDSTSNNAFACKGNPMKIMQSGEISSLQYSIENKADALVVDERTTRAMVESPLDLVRVLRRKLHCGVNVDKNKLNAFTSKVGKLPILRSSELVTIAYMSGMLDEYKSRSVNDVDEKLLDSILWSVKLHGCAISDDEITQMVRLAKGKRI